MNEIHVLDCTLRDGGYINDWRFGDKNSQDIVNLVSASGVDYVELAFIKNCKYERDKIEFNEMSQISRLFRPSNQKLSAMVEIGYGYPVGSFPMRSEETVDLVRLVVWKRMIKQSYEYAKELQKRGYEVGIQATRIEQYSYEEFKEFVQVFSQLSPIGIYIVDTFGLLNKERLLDYASIADQNLGEGIYLGYHAHNNMQQAFSNMVALTEHPWNHPLILDASIMGMGRGAGNLCLELFEKYLNENYNGEYKEDYLYHAADKYIIPIYEKNKWGYSIPYLLSAKNGRNPSFVKYLTEKGLNCIQMASLFSEMKKRDVGIIYDTVMCDNMINELFPKLNVL
jgi:4-hydroxy 2-oxovalerate aldolase